MQNTKNPLIFIINDSMVYKDLIVGYLTSRGFNKLKTFKSGEEALKLMHLKPDIVVLDYSFEGITGLEFMRKVQDEHPRIDFVFLSGQNDVNVAVNIMKRGAADYIVKNDKAPENLLHSIEYLISSTKKEKVRKGFQVSVIGFFIMMFLLIMIIILLTVFLEDFNF